MRLTLLTICALTLTSCTQNSGRTTGEFSYVAGDGSTIFVATKERQSAVTLSGKSLSGEQLSTSNWLGKVVVVNLWASWCGPCRSEAKVLANSYKEFSEQDVEFIGLNTRDSLATATAFNDRFPTGYPSIQDADGELILRFGNLGPAATPSTIVLDRSGRVAARVLGPVTQAQLRGIIAAVASDGEK